MYGPVLEELPKGMPISLHVLNDPMFQTYLQSAGIEAPQDRGQFKRYLRLSNS
jgi:hypothetical protein|tara:strand:- start:12864 stop:13022 length:159 start_codon:yes stop_codon:yes gene_type:complete